MEKESKELKSLLSQNKAEEFVKKVSSLSKEHKLDLSTDEDLSIAIMNLISIEEHFFFTHAKTGKDGYVELLRVVREMRKKLLKRMITEYEGEVWCISKHLLAASMRLMEVGTKQLTNKNTKEAKKFFRYSYELYLLFWGLNLKVIKSGEFKEAAIEIRKKFKGLKDTEKSKEKKGLMGKLGALVKKAIDCCIE